VFVLVILRELNRYVYMWGDNFDGLVFL